MTRVLPLLAVACGTPPGATPEAADPRAQMLAGVPADAVRFSSEWGCYSATNPGGVPIQDIVDTVGPYRVLVVDEFCSVSSAGLLLPDRFTLTGAGWTGSGALIMEGTRGIWFDGGADQDVHGTVSNLQIQGTGAGTGISLINRHQVHLRDLTVRGFTTAILADTSFSVTVEHCNLNQNEVGLSLGTEANGWRVFGGICSQNDVCMDLHPGGDGNDTMVVGVRMESNDVAIQVGGLSTYIAFNRFEGNGDDVVRSPTSQGTALFANNTAWGTTMDLSELNDGALTTLPLLDRTRMSIVPNSVTADLGTHYVPPDGNFGGNVLRTVLTSNQTTDDGVTSEFGYAAAYAGWQLEMDGGTAATTSEVRLAYRAPGAVGQPAELFRVASDGTVYATAFSPLSDARLKDRVQPVNDALAKVSKLRGVSWRWADGPAAGGTAMGLLAQEVEAVFPDAVRTGGDGTKTVSYDGLTAPIVEAIGALAEENAELRRRLEALEQR